MGPKPAPLEWHYARFQAIGRAQSRYFLLALFASAYTFGLSVSRGDTVSVAILGLPPVERSIINAVTMVVLGVLLLALLGALQAAREAGDELRDRLAVDGIADVPWHVFDQHPNLADLAGYAGYKDGKPRDGKPWGALVWYLLPVLGFYAWDLCLWWRGHAAVELYPAWLEVVYYAGALLMVYVGWCVVTFIRRRWALFRQRG